MKKHAMAALLAAVGLTLASCGGNAGGGDQGDMQGMNHGGSGGNAEASEQAPQETTGGEMSGMDLSNMDQGEMGSGDMASMSRKMVMPGGEYSDAAFVDSMVPHHEGAVEMAEVGLDNAEHEEIRQLSRDIIDSQQAEIEKFGRIREGLDGPTTEMSEEDMSMMGMMDGPQQLANEDPFDKAFIDNMIPHHRSAIAMAEVAVKESEDPEIREIANDIVSAQEREIGQMKQWRQEWYPQG
jgi:uncharacterized protein (DUF305 family)